MSAPTAPVSSNADIHQGAGGKVRICTNLASAATLFEVKAQKWDLTKGRGIAKVTHGLSNGISQSKATIKKQEGTIEFLWQSTVLPEALNFMEGATVALWLGIGDSGSCYYCAEALIKELKFTNDEDEDVVKYTATFECQQAVLFQSYPTDALTSLPLPTTIISGN